MEPRLNQIIINQASSMNSDLSLAIFPATSRRKESKFAII